MNELMNDGGVYRAAPGFARVCKKVTLGGKIPLWILHCLYQSVSVSSANVSPLPPAGTGQVTTLGRYGRDPGHQQHACGHLQLPGGHLQLPGGHFQLPGGHLQLIDGHDQVAFRRYLQASSCRLSLTDRKAAVYTLEIRDAGYVELCLSVCLCAQEFSEA